MNHPSINLYHAITADSRPQPHHLINRLLKIFALVDTEHQGRGLYAIVCRDEDGRARLRLPYVFTAAHDAPIYTVSRGDRA